MLEFLVTVAMLVPTINITDFIAMKDKSFRVGSSTIDFIMQKTLVM